MVKFGFLPILIFGTISVILLLMGLKALYTKSERIQKFLTNRLKELMWSSVIKFITSGYFILSLDTLGSIHTLGESDLKTRIMFILNMCIVVVFPIFTYRFLESNLSQLENKKFKEKYGALYANVYLPNED